MVNSISTTYGVAALSAALVALIERFGMSPIPAAAQTHVVARKADDRVLPRGRRL